MPSPRTISRNLRIIASATFGVALVLLIALWQRSYRQYDTLYWPGVHHMTAVDGWLHIDEDFQINRMVKRRNHQIGSVRIFTLTGSVTPQGVGMAFPIWLAVALVAPFLALPWMRWHYSLRTLVTLATLIAIGLAVFSALKRLRGNKFQHFKRQLARKPSGISANEGELPSNRPADSLYRDGPAKSGV